MSSSRMCCASDKESKKVLGTKPGKLWNLISKKVKAFKSFLKCAKTKKYVAQTISPSESEREKHVAQTISPSESERKKYVAQTISPFESERKKHVAQTISPSESERKKPVAKTILPSDVITEILFRLPPKVLIKLQLVCKDWKTIIRNPHFTEKYMNDSAIARYVYNVVVTTNPVSTPVKFAIIYCRFGLLLLKNKRDHSYCLWNPAIHKVLQLPDPQEGSYGFALSYTSATRSFKLMSFYKDGDSGEACEVFVPGQSEAWRRLTSFPGIAQVVGDETIRKNKVSVVAAGEDVHCIRIFKFGTKTYGEIISVETESFCVTSFQKGVFRDLMKVEALDWNGKLGICDIVERNLDVMVLEDFKKHKWGEKKKTIQLPFVRNENYAEEGDLTPLFTKNADVWFWGKNEKVFTYTMDTGKVTIKLTLKPHAVANKFCPYKPSMVSFEGMQPDTELHYLRPRLVGY